jgi:hypothetical protein
MQQRLTSHTSSVAAKNLTAPWKSLPLNLPAAWLYSASRSLQQQQQQQR